MSDQSPQKHTIIIKRNTIKQAIVFFGAILVLGISIFAAYRYSQSKSGGIVLPGGTTYLGQTPTIASSNQPSQTPPTKTKPSASPLRFTADTTVPYKEHYGTSFPFSFSFPETLPLVVFINDPYDNVAISWGNIPAQQNILLNVELLAGRDKTHLYKTQKDYVGAWWKYFSGLKGVASVTPFTNINQLKGYKAQYVNWANETPNQDVFFEIPGRSDIMIHLANGILDQTIFDRIVDSVKWITPTPIP